MAAHKKRANRTGRPPKVGARLHSIRITDEVRDFYRSLGGGSLTRGIERVAVSLRGSKALEKLFGPGED